MSLNTLSTQGVGYRENNYSANNMLYSTASVAGILPCDYFCGRSSFGANAYDIWNAVLFSDGGISAGLPERRRQLFAGAGCAAGDFGSDRP